MGTEHVKAEATDDGVHGDPWLGLRVPRSGIKRVRDKVKSKSKNGEGLRNSMGREKEPRGKMKLDDVPNGLSSLEYAKGILHEILESPADKSNLLLIAECIDAISIRRFRGREDAKRLACFWLSRRVEAAVESGAQVNGMWFRNAEYRFVEKPGNGALSAPYCGKCESGYIVKEVASKYDASKKERRAFVCDCRRAK